MGIGGPSLALAVAAKETAAAPGVLVVIAAVRTTSAGTVAGTGTGDALPVNAAVRTTIGALVTRSARDATIHAITTKTSARR